MKRIVKNSAKKGLLATKKVANSNKFSRKLAQKAKKVVLIAAGSDIQRELYNLKSFYPTIQEYYYQTQDFKPQTDPLISILLPTYNTPEEYLRECIESIIVLIIS